MSRLKKLIDTIIKDGKMNNDTVITHLISALDEEKDDVCEYKELYEEVYGHTLTRDIADDWVKSMAVTDNTERANGQKWTLEQTTDTGNKIAVDWSYFSKIDFYIAMNMMYSDFYKTAKSVNLAEDALFFARLARDWLCDEDASEDKLYNYYFSIIL